MTAMRRCAEPGSRDGLLAHMADMVASSPHNLVSTKARSELMTRHVPESVHLARALPRSASRLLDVGSGGGFPGLVIAIVRPDLEVHLLDSTAKKTAFLTDAASSLGLSLTVHTGRAEELAKTELRGSFDLVTARAVAPLERLLPLTIPFLCNGGRLYAVKGAQWAAELASAAAAMRLHRVEVLATPDDADWLGEHEGSGKDRDDLNGPAPKVVVLVRKG